LTLLSLGGDFGAADSDEVGKWFREVDTASLLAYYGVPLLLTADNGFFALTSADQVVAAVQPQVDGMRAAHCARSEVLSSEVTVLNSKSALVRETLSRRRSDGQENSRLAATYLVTVGAVGSRISVLAVHNR